MALFAVPLFLIAAASLALLLDDRVASLVPPTLFSIILCVYVFGLVDQLSLGFWCAIFGTVGLAVYAGVRVGRNGLTRAMAEVSSPGIVLWVLFAVLMFAVTRDMQLAHYDDFSIWGRVARAMFLHDALGPFNPVELSFRSYPPASGIFEYVVARLGGAWSEANLLWSYQILVASLFVPFMARMRWRDTVSIVTASFLLFATMHVFRDPLRSTLVEPLLSMLFGYLLALVYVSDPRRWRLTLYLSLGLATLVLIKDAGSFFALVVLFAYLLRLFLSTRDTEDPLDLKAAAARFATAVAATWAAQQSWSRLLTALDVKRRFAAPIELRELLGFLTGDVRPHWTEVVENYATAFVETPIVSPNGLAITQAIWFVIFAAVLAGTAWAVARARNGRTDWGTPIIALVGGAAYALTLLIFYLYRFAPHHALGLNSFERYLGTYWAGLTAFTSFVLLWGLVTVRADRGEQVTTQRGVYAVVTAWCVVLLLLVPLRDAATSYIEVPRFNAEVRRPYAEIEQSIERADIGLGSKVLVLAESGGGGLDGQVMTYLLINSTVDFLGPSDASGEATVSPSGFAPAKLAGYDYVAVRSGSRADLETLDHLLYGGRHVEAGVVYAVESDGEEVRLVDGNW